MHMDTTHKFNQVLGGVLFVVGFGFLLLLLRSVVSGHIGNIWNFGSFALLALVSLYLGGSGLRMVSPGVIKPFRFGWGRIILGSWILFGTARSLYGPPIQSPLPVFKPSNRGRIQFRKVGFTPLI
jgi:hypothetical protein